MVIVFSGFSAYAANIAVPTTRLTNQTIAVTVNTLKPAACSGIVLTAIIYCPSTGGACDGTNASELIIGSPNIDLIVGKGGSDCILGGGGDDDITGSQSRDICIGGPGNDTFKKCETAVP
jgi:Ca2+-binding RTX toxin-like protein